MTDIKGRLLCSQGVTVTPQYVRDASGSVLLPNRLIHKLHGRGLAKSTICWVSLSLFPPCLLRLFFFSPLLQIQIKKHRLLSDYLQNKSFSLVRRESLVKARRHNFSSSSFSFFFLLKAFATRDL